jgi:hypothetical protein
MQDFPIVWQFIQVAAAKAHAKLRDRPPSGSRRCMAYAHWLIDDLAYEEQKLSRAHSQLCFAINTPDGCVFANE